MKAAPATPFVLLLGLVASQGIALAAESTRAVSAVARASRSGGGDSFAPVFSADGRFVVFLSCANNLVTNDGTASHLDVFRHELSSGQTVLVSVDASGRGGGNDNSAYASISSNGQFVAFSSAASNLVGDDPNGVSDVFVRDLDSQVTVRASMDLINPGPSRITTAHPLISAEGRWVVFETKPPKPAQGSSGSSPGNPLFARDLLEGRTLIVNLSVTGAAPANAASELGSMTPDARFVAFVSSATDLVPNGPTASQGDVYVRDLQAEVTRWASQNVETNLDGATDFQCLNPVVSADGRLVAFKAATSRYTRVYVIHHDLQSGARTVLTTNGLAATPAAISADGRLVAYENGTNVYVWDAQTGSNQLVSVNGAGTAPGNGPSRAPVMTPDGQTVAFLSAASDLVTNTVNGFFQLYVRDLVSGTTRLVSVNREGAASSDVSAIVPSLSADGHLVAFDSVDENLVEGDCNQASDIFIRDLRGGTTTLCSQRDPSLPSATPPAAGAVAPDALAPSGNWPKASSMAAHTVSADGRRVVFSSYDSTLAPGDSNRSPDLFVRDLVANTNIPITTDPAGQFLRDRICLQPAISANGRFAFWACVTGAQGAVTFSGVGALWRRDLVTGEASLITDQALGTWDGTAPLSKNYFPYSISADGSRVTFQSKTATETLAPGVLDGNAGSDVFLADPAAGSNQAISLNRSGVRSGNGASYNPILSPDGRWVLFASTATDLPTNNTAGMMGLFARDVRSGTTRLVSVGPASNQVVYSSGAVFSADSRHVAFVSGSYVYVRDLEASASVEACYDCLDPSPTASGRFVAFRTRNTYSHGYHDIVLRDLRTGMTNLISVNLAGTGGGNGHSSSPIVSDDGHYVVFASQASDLVPDDNNRAGDIFVRDLRLNTTLLISLNRFGTGSGNGHSTRPVLGADGSTVVFLSYASDLVEGDFNHQRDVFLLHLPDADSDGDGLEDEWEVAHFGDLSHDGSEDTDQDGLTDRQEYLAGTDPTNRGSVLRVLQVVPITGGPRIVVWSAIPGRDYRVQYKDRVTDPNWSELPFVVTAATTTGHFVDNTASGVAQRFYRVTLVP